mmetsp:Transcript_91129/g.294405  ORF Transcript_91129/g.294405 Transcript_91129/m.294405 type:complete len:256 (-) Transcript_91129:2097-2864(-)
MIVAFLLSRDRKTGYTKTGKTMHCFVYALALWNIALPKTQKAMHHMVTSPTEGPSGWPARRCGTSFAIPRWFSCCRSNRGAHAGPPAASAATPGRRALRLREHLLELVHVGDLPPLQPIVPQDALAKDLHLVRGLIKQTPVPAQVAVQGLPVLRHAPPVVDAGLALHEELELERLAISLQVPGLALGLLERCLPALQLPHRGLPRGPHLPSSARVCLADAPHFLQRVVHAPPTLPAVLLHGGKVQVTEGLVPIAP